MTISALESYLDLVIARARYGRKLNALARCAYVEMEKTSVIESDQSLPPTTRKRLIRECEAELGASLRLAKKHGKARQVVDVIVKPWPRRQSNQENVFKSYRAVLRREGQPPKLAQLFDNIRAELLVKSDPLLRLPTFRATVKASTRLAQFKRGTK